MIPKEFIKKIIHVDMDAFFASVEQLDFPELKGKPIAVGGSAERGVVAAASYEARQFGVRSAMSSALAKRKCPDLIFVKHRFDRYKEVSLQIREIFARYTDKIEPLSLDEAYLDVTENHLNCPSASLIAHLIRNDIFKETGLTASAGISINKFTAKIASDYNKPNGQWTVPPEEVELFLEELPVSKFYGVGKVTAEKMNKLGITFGKQLKAQSLDFLVRNFGKSGLHYYNIVRGLQKSEVKSSRKRKSIGAERTFIEDSRHLDYLDGHLEKIASELAKRLAKNNAKGRTLTLKIKYADFKQQTRSRTKEDYYSDQNEILQVAKDLLRQSTLENSVRLLGIQISNLENPEIQSEFEQQSFDF